MFSSETHCLFFIGDPLFLSETHCLFSLETPYFYRRLIVFFYWRPLIFTGDSLSFFIDDPLFLPETHCLFYWRPLVLSETHWLFIKDPLISSETHFSLETPFLLRDHFFHESPLVFQLKKKPPCILPWKIRIGRKPLKQKAT